MVSRRIGIVGDIHCEAERLAASLEHLIAMGADTLCAVGDIVDGEGDPNRCIELLERRGVLTVAGNHERWLLSDLMRDLPDATVRTDLTRGSRDFLRELPRTRRLETARGPALLCHGLGEQDMAGVRPDDFGYALETNDALTLLIARGERLVFCGHTHQRMVRTIDGLTLVNAGALARDSAPCCAWVDADEGAVIFFDVAADGVVTEASRHRLPDGATAPRRRR